MNRYAIIGYGKFGSQLTDDLSKYNNISIKVCDHEEDRLKNLADIAGVEPIVIDCADKDSLEEAGIVPGEIDLIIVCVGDSIEASILTVFALQELGNKKIIVKVVSKTHASIMMKCGASRTIYPESDAAKLLSQELVTNKIESYLISDAMRMCKGLISSSVAGKSVQDFEQLSVDLELEADDDNGKQPRSLKVVALKHDDGWELDITPNLVLNQSDFIVFLVSTNIADIIAAKFEK